MVKVLTRNSSPPRDAEGVEASGVDAVKGAVLEVALPSDDEIAVGVHRHARFDLDVRGGGSDAELAPLRDAGGVVASGDDVQVGTVRAVAGPGDDEIAVGVQRHARLELKARGESVDAEFASLRRAAGVVALGVDAVAVAVLNAAGPDDDEVSVGVHRHFRVRLVAAGEGVDEEFVP
ncbi:MAG: hypothetical protein ACRC1K_19690 [Planctomycetia bacterium]